MWSGLDNVSDAVRGGLTTGLSDAFTRRRRFATMRSSRPARPAEASRISSARVESMVMMLTSAVPVMATLTPNNDGGELVFRYRRRLQRTGPTRNGGVTTCPVEVLVVWWVMGICTPRELEWCIRIGPAASSDVVSVGAFAWS
ncbi:MULTISPECIES: hypothetical protein [Mycolicibacterium]|uniref:Uncharacterized protein n=2 Tax=Mycobacteriaceae TaxID=1762 RepID=A0ABT8H918_MYCAO|nr:hypothetical protein [Mycolicibacterium austroafricanum]MDN4517243.1 hypothetical protein [Mycolicibacterium austroafricanum]